MLPICEICAKTKVLCNSCETKLKNGEISELDVKLSQIVYEIGHGNFGFKKAIDTPNFIVMLTQRENIGKIFGEGGQNLIKLKEAMGKQIKPIPIGKYSEMIYNLVQPATIVSVRQVYKANGEVIKKVVLSKRNKEDLRMDISTIAKIISEVAHENVEIVFE